MNYIIFGTGRCAKTVISEHTMGYFREHSIIAFTDNDKMRWGNTFYGKEIVPPHRIGEYPYDQILVCSEVYKAEIMEQLEGMGIDRKSIMTLNEMRKVYADDLIDNKNLLDANILIVGCEDSFLYRPYNSLFRICGMLDIKCFEKAKDYKYDYIILENCMDIPYLDHHMGRIALERQWIHTISEKCHINEEKIFTYAAVRAVRCQKRKQCWGSENPDKTFLVVKLINPANGLGACVCQVQSNVAYAASKGWIPVVDMREKNQYLEDWEIGKVNAWEKFFEQPAGYRMQDIEKSENIIISYAPVQGLKPNLDFLRIKPGLEQMKADYMKNWKGRTLGVLFRGSDYANTKPYGHSIQPNLEEMILKVKEKLVEWGGTDYIYLCTEVEEAVLRFREEFGDRLKCYPQQRVHEDFSDFRLAMHKFPRQNDGYYRGAEYWTALSVLSECDSLVAGACGATWITVQLNHGRYKHCYVFNLGFYGIDDVDSEDDIIL